MPYTSLAHSEDRRQSHFSVFVDAHHLFHGSYVVEHVGQEAVRNFLADGAINPDRMKAFRR